MMRAEAKVDATEFCDYLDMGVGGRKGRNSLEYLLTL